MAIMKNVSPQAALAVLKSRREIILAPGEKVEVVDSEVRDNPTIDKLRQRGIIVITGSATAESAPGNTVTSAQDAAASTASRQERERAENKKGKH